MNPVLLKITNQRIFSHSNQSELINHGINHKYFKKHQENTLHLVGMVNHKMAAKAPPYIPMGYNGNLLSRVV